jgi:hypothetical protein
LEDKRGAYRVLVVRPNLEDPKCRWEDIIMDLQEVGWEGMDQIALAQDRDRWQVLVNYSNEPSGSTKRRELLDC